jgi:hypothetical protein
VRPRRGVPGPPRVDPTRRQQGQYLRRLGRVIVATYGTEADCELRWQAKLPYLPYLLVRGVPVSAVSTSAGWRFLWNRYRSHSVTDPSGAASALMADLSLPPRPAPEKGPADDDQTVSGEGPADENGPRRGEGAQADA